MTASPFTFTLTITPVAKARPRFDGIHHRTYTPAKTARYEADIARAARAKMRREGRKPFTGCAVRLSCVFRYKPPQRFADTAMRLAFARAGLVHKRSRPDIDNLVKAVLDALNGVAYTDDNIVADIHAKKQYSATDSVTVEISEIEE